MSQNTWLTDRRSQRLAGAAALLVPLLFGVYALVLDQDANWDLKNYHWYNPYAFLTGRWDIDILPAQIPTFYNPTLDVPFFLLAQAVPARVAGFVLGVVQGLNFVLLYLVALQMLSPVEVARRRIAALVLALVGVIGGGNLGLIGTTFYDNVVSLFVLASLGVVLQALRAPRLMWLLLAAAGVLAGAGAGLKLPTTIFAIGLCGALLVLGGTIIQRVARSFVFGVGVLAGIGVCAGHWMWFLWTTYHNPIFPYFNGLFDSPMGVAASYRDTRFIPESWSEWLAFPILSALDPMQAGEIVFRDGRIAAAFLVLMLTLIMTVLNRSKNASPSPIVTPQTARFVIAATVLTYIVWLVLFAIYRYIMPLEMLSPLVIAAGVAMWPVSARSQVRIVGGILFVVTITAAPGSWGRIPWGPQFIQTTPPKLPRPDQTMVLMLSTAPTSWVVPAFPAPVSFVRVQGFGINPADGDTGLNRRIAARIAAHHGDLFTLAGQDDRALAETLLARYGLTLGEPDCRPITSNLAEGPELCFVRRKENP